MSTLPGQPPIGTGAHPQSVAAANTETIGGTVNSVSSGEFNFATNNSCGADDAYWQAGSTVLDGPTPAPGYYVQMTGVGATPLPCNHLTATNYLTVSASPIPHYSGLSGTVQVVYGDGTFSILSGGGVTDKIVQNSYDSGNLSPVVGQDATVTGFGNTGSGHFIHGTTISMSTPSEPKYTKVHVYIGNDGHGDGCSGLSPGSTIAEQTTYEAEQCGSGSDAATACPVGGTCYPEYYFDPHVETCSSGDTNGTNWNNQAQSDEAEFQHTGPPSSSNRLGSRAGSCNGALSVNPNPSNSTNTAWWKTNVLSGRPSNARFFDDDANLGRFLQNGTTNTGPHEFLSLAAWRSAIGTEIGSYGTTYPIVLNAFGSGHYPCNNDCDGKIDEEGIVNFAADIDDVCSNASGGSLQALVSEQPLGENSSGSLLLEYYNWPIYINNASVVFNDCAGTDFQDLELTSIYSGGVPTESHELEKISKAFQMLIAPPDGSQRVVAFHYVVDYGKATPDEYAVFPQDEVVFTAPFGNFGKWHWGGSADDGDGCGSGDTGGAHDLIAPGTCGIGVDATGAGAGIWIREGACFVLGSLEGPCAVVINPTTTSHGYSANWFPRGDISAYHHRLTWSGGPVSAVCSPSSGCNGALDTTSVAFNGTSDTIAAQDADILFP